MNHRRFPTWRAAGLAVVVLAVPSSVLAQAAPRITLAGTFNNWSTSSDEHRLAKVGERYELRRFWPCGRYEFKFVFNGTWDKHLGDAGDGKLTQPGGNIVLRIPQSAEYAVWLDPDAKHWGLEKKPPPRLRAVIQLHDAETGLVLLDGSASAHAPRESKIKSYNWSVTCDAPEPGAFTLDAKGEKSPAAARLIVHRSADYRIQLTVADGKKEDTAEITRTLHPGWRFKEETIIPESGARGWANGIMLPLDGGLWAAPQQLLEGRAGALVVVTRADQSDGEAADRRRYSRGFSSAAARRLLTFDPAKREVSSREGGWHEFAYRPKKDKSIRKHLRIERVDLVGDFNGWQTGVTPLFSTEQGAVYRRILLLAEGVHHYKFVVNGCFWVEDPSADKEFHEADQRGGFNSGVLVGLDGTKLGPAKPDHINQEALKHDPSQAKYFTPISKNLVRLVVRTLADDVQEAQVTVPGERRTIPMEKTSTVQGFDYWTALEEVETAKIAYHFDFSDGAATMRLSASGPVPPERSSDEAFEQEITLRFATPDWAKKAVWYQIFPERFRNGDAANDPPRTVPWQHEWFKPYRGKSQNVEKSKSQNAETPKRRNAEREAQSGGDFTEEGTFYQFIFDRRYGGDIQGIREKLPYLHNLGVTAIYLNPVFQAASLHKYDAADYRHIDDSFAVKDSWNDRVITDPALIGKIAGETEDPATWQWSKSDKVFLDFLKEAHRQGFKIIIDGVFNHTGREFWAFQDLLKNKEKSRYVDWFDITSLEPFHYKGWDRDDGALPRLKHDEKLGLSKPVREHLFAVTRRWMDPNGDGDPSDGIDGWRLDVASDINAHFWRDWRKLVKSINPDAYIVAELWEKSVEWLTGDTFDAVMNYPFARSCQRFFVNQKKTITPAEFGRQLAETLGWYPPQVNYVQQNLLDSHDTDRVASMFMNPDLEYDKANRLQDNGPKYDPAKPTPECYQRLKTLVTVQMTFLGAPMVYYGDEVGMYGADDPTCRKPMLWPDLLPYDDPNERIEPDVYEHYRQMIAIRNSVPALRLGSFEVLLAEEKRGVFAFSRTLSNETVVVVVNNSDRARKVDVPVSWPAGSRVVRLDDPQACRVVDPPEDSPKARPTIQAIEGYATPLKVTNGRLQGMTLAPRTAGVFRRIVNK